MCDDYLKEYIIPALISGGFTFIGVLIAYIASKKNTKIQMDDMHKKDDLNLYRSKIEQLVLLGNRSAWALGQFQILSDDIQENRAIVKINEKHLADLRAAIWEMNAISSMYFGEYIKTDELNTKILQPIINLMKIYREQIEFSKPINHDAYGKAYSDYIDALTNRDINNQISYQINEYYQKYLYKNCLPFWKTKK